jgi:carbon-monoxide dehydrogenase medium subunit
MPYTGRWRGDAVKPPPFEYHAAHSLDEAVALLAESGDDGRVLAGGQSLVPLLSLRLARPSRLIDVNGIGDLAHISASDGGLSIGATTRQRAVERSDVVRERCPMLADAVALIGHTAIRNRGTVGGSLAHADPAAELPAVAVAMDAELVARSPRGERAIPASVFFLGHYTTALEPDECLVDVRVPPWPPRAGSSFQEVSRRHGDFAMVAVAALVELDGSNTVARARIALAGVADTPVRADEAEAFLAGADIGAAVFAAAGEQAAAAIDPPADVHASSAYRRHAVRTLVRRALEEAAQRAGEAR